jgi:predicted PolB exonuclease-like 3'-5' exonuclease
MRFLTLDIETIAPGWEPPEDDPGAFPPMAKHRPCVVSWLIADIDRSGIMALAQTTWDIKTHPEREILRRFKRNAESADRLITYNGRGFDMPILGQRASHLCLDWQWWYSAPKGRNNEVRARFPHWKDGGFPWHFDLMDQISDYGSGRGWKLSDVAQSYGLPGKVGCEGSQVGAMWENGLTKSIARYCAHDVFLTWMVFIRRWASCTGDTNFNKHWEKSIDWARAQCDLRGFYPEGSVNGH